MIFKKSQIQKSEKSSILASILASFWEPFGIIFRYFFGIDFWMTFWMPFFRFLMENGSQNGSPKHRKNEDGEVFDAPKATPTRSKNYVASITLQGLRCKYYVAIITLQVLRCAAGCRASDVDPAAHALAATWAVLKGPSEALMTN